MGAVSNKEINPNENLPPPPQPQKKAHETNLAKTLLNKKGILELTAAQKLKTKYCKLKGERLRKMELLLGKMDIET